MQQTKKDPLQIAVSNASKKMSVPVEKQKNKKQFNVQEVIRLASEAKKTFKHEDLTRLCL